MIVNGIKYLDNNSYSCIKINQDPNNKKYVVDVQGKNINELVEDNRFSDYLKNKSDYKKIIAIIEYYMNTSKIFYMSTNRDINIIEGDKRLELHVFDDRVKKYLSVLELKYKMDRDNFLNNTICNKYSLNYSSNYTNYRLKNDRIELTLLRNCEKDFLDSFIHSKLKNSNNSFIVDKDYKLSELIIDEVNIYINNKDLINDVKFITYKYQSQMEKLKIGGLK